MSTANEDDVKTARLKRRQALGAELRRAFADVADEEAPERLRELAESLDRKLSAAQSKPDGETFRE